jgi:hypothetical protein
MRSFSRLFANPSTGFIITQPRIERGRPRENKGLLLRHTVTEESVGSSDRERFSILHAPTAHSVPILWKFDEASIDNVAQRIEAFFLNYSAIDQRHAIVGTRRKELLPAPPPRIYGSSHQLIEFSKELRPVPVNI